MKYFIFVAYDEVNSEAYIRVSHFASCSSFRTNNKNSG